MSQSQKGLHIESFGNTSPEDMKKLKTFIDFHWTHYAGDKQYIPLLDYEYLGFKLIAMTGFFEPKNLFFKHADMRFFMAYRDGKIVGRCNAFVNERHNQHWNDKTGFFGQFEAIDDHEAAYALFKAAEDWLREKGMDTIRGPQNLPVNDATPGFMTEGFDSRPVMYYHYNKPYYADLAVKAGYTAAKRVKSWEVDPKRPMEEKLLKIGQKVIDRYDVTIESWGDRPLEERKKEMLEIYNAAWNDNYGFVPFTEEEFSQIIDDMLLIMDKKLFIFLYVKGESAAFFGAVPNVAETLTRIGRFRHMELLRAVKLVLGAKKCKGFRLGYLGVKPKFRRLGLDGVMLWKQKMYTATKYEYCDMGWVLEDNTMTVRLIEMMGSAPSKTYTIFEKKLN